MVGTLFREKTYEIVGQITCPVGIFVNRLNGSFPARISFLLGNPLDSFLIPYIDSVLETGNMLVRIFLLRGGEYPLDRWRVAYPTRVEVVEYEKLSQLFFERDSLLLLNYEAAETSMAQIVATGELPSLLVMKKGQNKVIYEN